MNYKIKPVTFRENNFAKMLEIYRPPLAGLTDSGVAFFYLYLAPHGAIQIAT